MKGTKVVSIPHPYGTRSRERAGHWEEYAREREARSTLAEQQDRHDYDRDMRLGIRKEIDRLHPVGEGGTGLEQYPTLRPLPHRVFGRRRSVWDSARAAGLAIPEALDRPDSQQEGCLFDVLAVGSGVTSCKPGDCVVVNNCVAADRGDVLGTGVYEFRCDVHCVNPDGQTDTIKRTGGDVLAVVLTDATE